MNTENVIPKIPKLTWLSTEKSWVVKLTTSYTQQQHKRSHMTKKSIAGRKVWRSVLIRILFSQELHVRWGSLLPTPEQTINCVIPSVKQVWGQLPSSTVWASLKGLPSLKQSKLKLLHRGNLCKYNIATLKIRVIWGGGSNSKQTVLEAMEGNH